MATSSRIASAVDRCRRWWRSPVSRRDRFLGSVVGGLGGFWIGALGMLAFAHPPVPLGTVGVAALVGAASGMLLGVLRPKVTMVVLFPFATFGGGGG